MSRVNLGSQFGKGGTGLTDGKLADAIKELQNLQEVVVDGAAANTNIAVAGIETTDTIISAIGFNGGVPAALLADASIPSNGNIQFSSATTGSKVVVQYLTKP